MKVGFTGTREGITAQQRLALRTMLEIHGSRESFHQGCCVGADLHVSSIAKGLGYRIAGHPPDKDTMLSRDALKLCDELYDPLPYLERNRRIVDACDVLLACPKGPEEQRSGTWSTVRYARKQGKRIVIFWPDGEVTEEGGAK